MIGMALFDTAIGPCGIAWTARGICGVQLPEADVASTRDRLSRRHAGAQEGTPPPTVQLAIEAIVALLAGQPARLEELALDLRDVPPFNLRVYEVTRAIPAGSTLSYGEIATRLGEAGAARAVGQALGQNPIPIIIPCHRVLAAGHRAGGFSAHGDVATKRRLLEIEGALAAETLPLFGAKPFSMEGGCSCRAARYRLEATPLFVHCCHCSWCQRETGSAFVLNAMVEADRVVLLTGAPVTIDTPSASGRGQRISRCPTCQVALWSQYAGSGPGIRFLRVGTLDEAHRITPDIHIYTSTKLPWVVLPQGARAVPEFYDVKAVWPAASLERFRAARSRTTR